MVHNSMHIIARPEHTISRANISENALKVLYRLREHGYASYLVGGSVRDLLLGRKPKDFDIATNAQPEQIRKLFRNSRLIGRRFRLAHVFFGSEIIEVATFRGTSTNEEDANIAKNNSGIILRDNTYGTIEEDALRRDFTINSLYYNIDDFSLIDFTQGVADLHDSIIRIIGDPEQRYIEDPVRMLRAIRFAAKLDMTIQPETAAPIAKYAPLLNEISPARLFDEVIKLFHGGHAYKTFMLLLKYDLLKYLFPMTNQYLKENLAWSQQFLTMINSALMSTDQRISEDKSVTPSFLFAVMLWAPFITRATELQQQTNSSESVARDLAIEEILKKQVAHTSIPRRYSTSVSEIWRLQFRFEKRSGKRAWRLLAHKRFRAAYDFQQIRSIADHTLVPLNEWWTTFQNTDEKTQAKMVSSLMKTNRSRSKNKKVDHE